LFPLSPRSHHTLTLSPPTLSFRRWRRRSLLRAPPSAPRPLHLLLTCLTLSLPPPTLSAFLCSCAPSVVPLPGSRTQMRPPRVRCGRRWLPRRSPPSDLAAQCSTRCGSQGGRSAVTRLVLGALWPSFQLVCTLLLG
uniref:Uncharacterized protein n=1 Tax=Triticum urartu TaxID=4572 RepID=A0A8R7QYM8_TRIUA